MDELMYCKHCGTELIYRDGQLVHAVSNRRRCRPGSHHKLVATIGERISLLDEEPWIRAEPT